MNLFLGEFDLFLGHFIGGVVAGWVNYLYRGRNPYRILFMGIVVSALFIIPSQFHHIVVGGEDANYVKFLFALARWWTFILAATLTKAILVWWEVKKHRDRLS